MSIIFVVRNVKKNSSESSVEYLSYESIWAILSSLFTMILITYYFKGKIAEYYFSYIRFGRY